MQSDFTTDSIALNDLHTVHSLAAEKPSVLTVDSLRWYLRHRDTNGLAPACVRLGKRLLISKSRFEHWLASRAGGSSI